MGMVIFWCIVLCVAVCAVWQLAAVGLWLYGKVHQDKPKARKETAVDRAFVALARDEDLRQK